MIGQSVCCGDTRLETALCCSWPREQTNECVITSGHFSVRYNTRTKGWGGRREELFLRLRGGHVIRHRGQQVSGVWNSPGSHVWHQTRHDKGQPQSGPNSHTRRGTSGKEGPPKRPLGRISFQPSNKQMKWELLHNLR